jgi:RND family efflux transporter MFP subunit
MPRFTHPFGLAIALGLLAAASGCARTSDSVGKTAAAKAPAGASVLDAVTVLPGGGGDAFTSFLSPSVDAPVIARSDGIVREVRVKEGTRVARGQVLARLDDDEQRLEVDYMGALSAQADAERSRAEKGAEGQWISMQTLEAARAKARAAKADLDLARLALERRTLAAPVAGVVWQVRAVAHRPVKTADVLFRVTDPARLQAELDLPAALSGRVRVGDAARLVPVGDGGATTALTAHVVSVSPMADPATGRFHVVLAAVAGTAARGAAGQPVRVELAGPHAGGALSADAVLPRDAHLERTGDALYAIRVVDGHARRVAVQLGALRADGFEVLSGLAPGDLVLAEGALAPADGAPVSARLRAAGR